MKKILLIALLLALLVAGNSFAQNKGWAIGAAFYFNWSSNASAQGASLCVKFPSVPIMFGLSASFADPLVIGITVDWWLVNFHLVGPVNMYIGPGLFLRLSTGPGADPYFGIRVPFGFQIFIVKAFEIFLEPALAIQIMPDFPQFGLQACVGFRFWF
jgi:hypothetical protein